MAAIAEAYLHYRSDSGAALDLEKLVRSTLATAERAATEYLPYIDPDVVARAEEGSRRVWATVIEHNRIGGRSACTNHDIPTRAEG